MGLAFGSGSFVTIPSPSPAGSAGPRQRRALAASRCSQRWNSKGPGADGARLGFIVDLGRASWLLGAGGRSAGRRRRHVAAVHGPGFQVTARADLDRRRGPGMRRQLE